MRRVRVQSPVATGQPVALDVVGDRGDVLVRAGAELTARRQRLLADRGAAWCYIGDLAGMAVQAGPVLRDETGALARAVLRDLVEALHRHVAPLRRQPTVRILEALHAGGAPVLSRNSDLRVALHEVAQSIATLAPDLDGRAGYLIDRHALDEIIGHPVGVAVIATRIGALIGFEPADLEATALAGLLHDLGLLLVPEELRATPPGRRSRPEQRRYEDHTILGEALIRQLLPGGASVLVAVEHHEHQDGAGYPRGLSGGHRILRTARDVGDPGRLMLVSEIVAVADRYERLLAPGPGFPGLPPAEARRELLGLSGSILNRELVERFVASIPVLPVGTEVRISGSPHDGALAVVTEPSVAEPHAPRVIVIEDASGRRVEPVEVNLALLEARALPVDEPAGLALVR